jgi:hypothetical protein
MAVATSVRSKRAAQANLRQLKRPPPAGGLRAQILDELQIQEEKYLDRRTSHWSCEKIAGGDILK